MPEDKKITLLVDEALADRLNSLVPHGFRRHLMASMLKLVLDAIETDGEIVIGAIMSNGFKLVRAEKQ